MRSVYSFFMLKMKYLEFNGGEIKGYLKKRLRSEKLIGILQPFFVADSRFFNAGRAIRKEGVSL